MTVQLAPNPRNFSSVKTLHRLGHSIGRSLRSHHLGPSGSFFRELRDTNKKSIAGAIGYSLFTRKLESVRN